MSLRKTCVICGKVFWVAHNMLAPREHLGCSEKCVRQWKSRRQRERRAVARQERLKRQALKSATRRKPKRGRVKQFVAHQYALPIGSKRRRRLKEAA